MSSVLLLQSVCAVLGFGAFSAGNVSEIQTEALQLLPPSPASATAAWSNASRGCLPPAQGRARKDGKGPSAHAVGKDWLVRIGDPAGETHQSTRAPEHRSTAQTTRRADWQPRRGSGAEVEGGGGGGGATGSGNGEERLVAHMHAAAALLGTQLCKPTAVQQQQQHPPPPLPPPPPRVEGDVRSLPRHDDNLRRQMILVSGSLLFQVFLRLLLALGLLRSSAGSRPGPGPARAVVDAAEAEGWRAVLEFPSSPPAARWRRRRKKKGRRRRRRRRKRGKSLERGKFRLDGSVIVNRPGP
ncbi:hypothetical protein L207DRAFT_569526 [Hyaloscypha variabilis F]|uniref:Uncharacterized protein n=1 Tax=Hyaloscypha variabilis (strain UAMH 11265 / GT02V1 / F) TaxID=1149755 RepID=A0A2J6RCC1_HYAVF|nr:hypothetical protein L207DRAFT_569526 [Hyaloscypha variabilis F]